MKHMCRICSNEYTYCHSCAITKNIFKNAGYCGENCYHISMILQKYGSKAITAAQAIEELKMYNIDTVSLRPSVDECYQNIVNEAKQNCETKIIEEIVQEDVEVVINNNEDMTISEIE